MSVTDLIQQKIVVNLHPLHLEVINESFLHGRPDSAESHFKVIIVSETFEGKSLLEQQRMVYSLLKEELQTRIHAFSLKTLTPSQWQQDPKQTSLTSPTCRGGSKPTV